MDLSKPNWGDDSMDDIMANVVVNPGWLFSCVLLSCFVMVFFFASYEHSRHSLGSQK